MGRCTGSGASPAAVTCSGPPPQQLDLLVGPAAAGGEVLAQGLVLDPVPAQAHAQAQAAAGEQVDLGGLLGDQGGLALGQDDDAGDQLQPGQGGQVAEQHHGLVERGGDVVGAGVAGVPGRVGAEDVLVGEQVSEAEVLDALGVGADGARVGADLGLGEDDTDLHGRATSLS
jgi:hypothetical protein